MLPTLAVLVFACFGFLTKMKLLLIAAAIACASIVADTVPDTAVVMSTETVVKTVSREPRMVVLMFDDNGTVSAENSYETVTRVGTNVVSRAPFRTTNLTWQQITNLVPSLALGLEQFKAASRIVLTNTP